MKKIITSHHKQTHIGHLKSVIAHIPSHRAVYKVPAAWVGHIIPSPTRSATLTKKKKLQRITSKNTSVYENKNPTHVLLYINIEYMG